LLRAPKVREVLKACNTTVPSPAPLKTRVRATARYFLCDDADKAAMHLVQREGEERPKMTLKSPSLVCTRLEESLKHVKQNFLSDEPSIPLYVEGGGRCTCARGTPGSEAKNLELQLSILRFKSVGFSKGERMFWCALTDSNDNANVSRRGADKVFMGTSCESRALANSLMTDNGYQEQFPDVSMPAGPYSSERLGFDSLQGTIASRDDASSEAPNEDEALDQSSDDDAEVEGEELDSEEEDENAETAECNGAIAKAHRVLQAVIAGREIETQGTTMEAFRAATGNMQWIPFQDDDSKISTEERSLFGHWYPRFKRRVAPSAKGGYNEFETEWNIEAGHRRIENLRNDDESNIPIFCKSTIQLQEYYDRMMQQRNAAYVAANPTGVARAAGLRITMRETRQGLAQPLVEHTAPRAYPQVNAQNIPTLK
jgi:hypothetical protein